MKLQKISILVFVALLMAFLLVVSIFFSTILLSSYRVLEEKYIEKDLDQAVNKLNDELNAMSSIASDWGPWDDTVDFVNGNAPNYLKSNLQPYSFDNLKLNLIVITNTQGDVIFSGAYDIQNKIMVSIPDFFSKRIDVANPLMNMSDPHQVFKGILMLPEYTILVVSQPIVHSDYSGLPQGVIIMGRNLNKDEIAKLASLTRPSLNITRLDDLSLSPDLVSRIKDNYEGKPGLILPLDVDRVAGYALIHDIFGNDSLVLQITETRDIYHQGINTTMQVIFTILLGGLFLGFAVITLLDRVVLKRMSSLVLQVKGIGQQGSTTDRVELQGDDELSGLAHEINRMLQTIEQTQQKVLVSEKKYRDLVENLPDYIIVYGSTGEILYINPAAERALGREAKTIIGTSVLTFVAKEFHEKVSSIIAARYETDEIPAHEIELVTEGMRRSVIVKGTKGQYSNNPATFLLLTDITRRKELERDREYHALELERYSTSLHQANTKLRLLTGLTRHDIQNKLTAMQSFHLLAMDESDMAINHEYIMHAHQAGGRMEAIIGFTREYENFGSVSSGWQGIYPIIESAKVEISLGDILIENQIPEDLEVYADPIIRKVFTTLLENAIRHGGEITIIRFTCHDAGDSLIITCEDDGTGIPAGEKEFIFEQGYGKHTGIGLFLAREILSITELSIKEAGVPGNGARFEILVPSGKFRKGGKNTYKPDK